MTAAQVIVTVAGVGLIAGLARFFRTRAVVTVVATTSAKPRRRA